MGLITSIVIALLLLALIFVLLELILDSMLDISLVMLLYSLSYDFKDLEMKPMQATTYGNRRRYIAISGIRSKQHGYEVAPLNIDVGFDHNRCVFDSFQNGRLNLRTKTLVMLELLEWERKMQHKKFDEWFDNL